MNEMKKVILTMVVAVLAASGMAQSDCGELLDANQDGLIGVEDLMNLLSHFGDSDLDFDGVFDSVDDCVGEYDECGLCNGPGPLVLAIDSILVVYDSLYVDSIGSWTIFEAGLDTLLHLVCENPGCTDVSAMNFDPYAEEGGQCIYSCEPMSSHGITYDAVQVDDQCWISENIRYLPELSPHNIQSETDPIAQVYDFDGTNIDSCLIASEYYDSWGVHYNYPAVLSWDLCPSPWRLPSQNDWNNLVNDYNPEGHLNLLAGPGDNPPYIGTNSSGMTVYAAGQSQPNGPYFSYEDGGWATPIAFFWTTDTHTHPWHGTFQVSASSTYQGNSIKPINWGLSVRCVKDLEN